MAEATKLRIFQLHIYTTVRLLRLHLPFSLAPLTSPLVFSLFYTSDFKKRRKPVDSRNRRMSTPFFENPVMPGIAAGSQWGYFSVDIPVCPPTQVA